jgi:hypothetical protein
MVECPMHYFILLWCYTINCFAHFSISLVVRLVYLVPSYYWYIKNVITNTTTVLIDLPSQCIAILVKNKLNFFRLNIGILVRRIHQWQLLFNGEGSVTWHWRWNPCFSRLVGSNKDHSNNCQHNITEKIFPYQDQVTYILVHILKWGAIIFSFQCVFSSKFNFFHDHLNFIWCLLWSLLLPTNLEKQGFHLQCHVTMCAF